MAFIHLSIFTPYGNYLVEEVDYLEVRNSNSVLGILPNHTPLISTVNLGMVKIKSKGKTRKYATTGGIINIKKGSEVVLMLNTIERSDEIDIERARKALERGEHRIKTNDGDMARAQAAIERATNRLKIAEGIEE